MGVAADDSGNLYVASYQGWYISKVVLATGQTSKISNFSVRYPQDMKIYGGNLYIASQGDNYIKVYSLATQQLVTSLYCPGVFALTIDSSGNVYAGLDSGPSSKIEVFLNGSSTPTVIKSSGLTSMTGLAITPSGQLYAADTIANTIYKIDTTNNYALTTVPIHVTQPRGLVFDSVGRLYVAAGGTPNLSNGMVLRYPANSYTDASGAILAQNLNYEEEVTIASTGDAYVTSYLGNLVTKISPRADFGTTVLVGSSATQTLSYTVNAGTAIGSWIVGNDQNDIGQFSLISNSCGTVYFASTTTCTATLQFAPLQAAPTHAWIDVLDNSNNVLSTVFTSGVGLAPQIAFNPTSSQTQPLGVGAVYGIVPLPNQRAAVASASAVYVGSLNSAPTLLASGLANPSELAIDGKQNLFVADTGNQRIATIPVFTDPTNPIVLNTSGSLATFSTSTASFTGVAVDGSGSVYYADATNNQIIRRDWTDTGYGPELIVATGISNPGAIAVDNLRNLFVLSGVAVLELPWTGQGYGTAVAVSSQLTTPSAISVDGAANLYVSDSHDGSFVEIPFSGNSYGPQFTLLSGITDARQAIIEYYGTLYVLGGSSGTITVADRINNLQLVFPATALQATSPAGPLSLQMQNIGTAAATFAALLGGNPYLSTPSFTFNSSSTCPVSTSSSSLAAGAVCTLAVDYTPQSLSATSGSLIFNDDSLNVAGSTQTVALSGTVVTSPTQVALSSLPSQLASGTGLGAATASIQDAYGNVVTSSTATITTTITGPNGYLNTLSTSASSGVANLNLNSLSLTQAGLYTIIASSSGLTSATTTVNVTPGPAAQLGASGVPSSVISGSSPGTITATVQDANENTVTNSTAPVTATITGPNGYSESVSANAVNGVASLNLSSLPLTRAGQYTVAISSNGLTSITTGITVTAGTAARLASSTVPSTVVSGSNPGTITATVQDASGNTVTNSTATLTTTITGPNGYSQTVTAPAVNGVANLNLSSLSLKTAGTYTVTTSSNGIAGTSSTVTVTPGSASQLSTSAVPSPVVSGGNLGTVIATVQDANGNTVTNSTATVSVTITGPDGHSQTVSANAANGLASLSLSSLKLTTAGTYTVATSTSGLAASTSYVTVNPGAASQVALGNIPGNVTAGQNLGISTATVRDANGNVVTNSSAQIMATLTGPNGFTQTVTATAVSGVITLDLSSLKPTAAGTYTLSVGGTDLATATSSIMVSAATQTITLPNLPNVTYGVGTTGLPSSSSAGLPITYTVTGPAVLNGTSLAVTGAGMVTVTATQAGDAGHSSATTTKSFTVAQAASTTMLSASSSVVISGTATTLTAHVGGTAGMPTGTVTFLNGTTVIGQGALTNTGSATLTLSTLPTGSLNVAASYSGDANFLASLSPLAGVAVQDFGIAPVVASTTPVVPGASTSFTLGLTPGSSGFSSPITLTASGLPAGATYSFSPATVTPGSSPANTVLTVQTRKPVATARNLGGEAGVTLALLVLPFGVSRRTRAALQNARRMGVVGLVLLLGSLAGLTGCGSNNGIFAQPQKNYTLTVTATSGSLIHTTTVKVDVQ